MTNAELIQEAKIARERSYSPYSHYKVGAALLTKSGKIYHGCNIENAAYTPTNCAERTAFFKAVYDGEREFEKIAVVGALEGGDPDVTCAPCGVCRQALREFCADDFEIILGKDDLTYRSVKLIDLLPLSFDKNNLDN